MAALMVYLDTVELGRETNKRDLSTERGNSVKANEFDSRRLGGFQRRNDPTW
jgi:hypothetical protein